MSDLESLRHRSKLPLISLHYKNGEVEIQDPWGCPDGMDPFRCRGPSTCDRAKTTGCFKYKKEGVDWSQIRGVRLTKYHCSTCGTQIPFTNTFVHRQSLLDKLLGHFEIQGFWCPVCGSPYNRCERIPPDDASDLLPGLVFDPEKGE